MEGNALIKNGLEKKSRKPWVIACCFLVFTFVVLLGYALINKFSWNSHGADNFDQTGAKNGGNHGNQLSPTQSSLLASMATPNSNQWDVKIEHILEQLTLNEIKRLTYAVPGKMNPGLPKLGIKPFTWNLDCYHGNGFSEGFPVSLALAATFSPEIVYKVAAIVGRKARVEWESTPRNTSQSPFGFVCFAPNANLMRDPRWSGNVNTLGEDPLVISTLVSRYISGLHGNRPDQPRIMSGCRYMSAFSGPEETKDPHNFDARIALADLYMTYWKPFRACVDAGSLAIMCSHHKINGIPSCTEYNQLSVELRRIWRYKGVVVSDVDAVRRMMTSQKYHLTSQDTASSCIAAGCNFELTSSLPAVFASQTISLANKTINEAQLRGNIKPILYTSMLLEQYQDSQTAQPTLDEEETVKKEALVKSFVLLKNDGVLPLRKKYKNMAMVGPAGEPLLSQDGSTLRGLDELAEKWVYIKGCQSNTSREAECPSVMDSVADADLIIITLSSNMSFTTKTDYTEETPKRITEMLNDIVKYVKPDSSVILLLFMGSPVDISWAVRQSKVSAILECFNPVKETGVALYRSLVNYEGQNSPGGRLPFTWPKSLDDLPKNTDYSMKNRTYRYSSGEPLFPFGFGLSYSKFEYSELQSPPQMMSFSPLPVSFRLTNSGPYDADEVIQAYIQWRQTHVKHIPRIQLVHFERVYIKAGNSQKFTLDIPYENFAIWTGHKQGYTTLPGDMTLYIGGQQPYQKMSMPSNILSREVKVIMARNPQQPGFG